MRNKRTVILGISSGIAAFKVLELIRLLREENISVYVIMTKAAAQMVDPAEFEKESGHKVYFQLFEKGFDYKKILKVRRVEHINLADSANLMVVLPATANIIAKIAHGIADDYLTTTLLAVTAPVIICPSMNVHMWQNPLVRENVNKLKQTGYQILGPDSGMLACGYTGEGRLINIKKVKDEILLQLNKTSALKGKKIIVTAGGTKEKIDAVRFITNRSSGKMGAAIAEACYLRGADVLFIRSENAVPVRFGIKQEIFSTAGELFTLLKTAVKEYDILFQTAAVSDFHVADMVNGKISGDKSFHLHLTPSVKIINHIKKINPDIQLVAFKAEYGLSDEEMINAAKKKLQQSQADAIIANDISKKNAGFESDDNEVIIIKNGKIKKLPLESKINIAGQIVDYLLLP